MVSLEAYLLVSALLFGIGTGQLSTLMSKATGFHAVCASMFDLAQGYGNEGMSAYVRLQEHEFALEAEPVAPDQRHVGSGAGPAVLQQEAHVGSERAQQGKKDSELDGQLWRDESGMKAASQIALFELSAPAPSALAGKAKPDKSGPWSA